MSRACTRSERRRLSRPPMREASTYTRQAPETNNRPAMKVPINQVACIDLDAPTLPAERVAGNERARETRPFLSDNPIESDEDKHVEDLSALLGTAPAGERCLLPRLSPAA